ncbi:hypothetical protein EGH25_04530 [Haladaptatus sp. F3-133]|uniref:DUF115 domain-containing protein n=1 Tax=Halorutilus salinus TaxID=2487751 RepID=A0A9Q4GGE7_9EURY|nr:hypothetical protein [Halorutilus salinus]MCX2818617.1 hypothetical protein [Halorutilus salinus]
MSKVKKTIEDMEGVHKGESIYIIGNGPSLNKTPLKKLDLEYTLAMSKIGLIYPDTTWEPSFYYFALPPDHRVTPNDKTIITQNADMGIQCFLHSAWLDILGNQDNVFYFDTWDLFGSPYDAMDIENVNNAPLEHLYEFWSNDVSNLVYHYHTIYGAIQVAVYMGFKQIYLLGCDMGQEYKNPHMIFESGTDPFRFNGNKYEYLRESLKNKNPVRSAVNAIAMKLIQSLEDSKLEKVINEGTNDHFTSDYLSQVSIADGPQNDAEIQKGHASTQRICKDKGVNIYNATLGGELEIYEKVGLEDVLSDAST